MKVIHKKINFRDARGAISDIFVNEPKDHVTLIYSTKGSVRGNHYHKKTTQYTFVITGQLIMYSQKLGGRKVYRHTLKANDMMIHEPYEVHTMKATKDTWFLAFANGVRGGKKYEQDTFRVVPPLA